MLATAFALALTLLLAPVTGEKPADAELSRNLRAALTHADFSNLLDDSDYIYDFSKVVADPYRPGSVLNANAATFPLLTDSRMSVAQLNMGPCAMLAPHSHPRATNIVVAVFGSTKTYMRSENGAKDRITTLTPGKMTVFPQGSMHAMVNEGKSLSLNHQSSCCSPYCSFPIPADPAVGCDNNLLYSFLNSDDPGTLNFAQSLWWVGQDIMQQVMPMIKVDAYKDWNATGGDIPDWGLGSQDGFEACRAACGMLDKDKD